MVKHRWTDEACHTLSCSWSHIHYTYIHISKNFISRQDSEAEPCLLCNVLRGVRGHIDSVRDRENEVGLDLPNFADNDEPDVSNSTHTTQVDMEQVVCCINQDFHLSHSRFLMMGQLSILTRQQ